jgi:4-aminobutyrate aminotransferase/(S)-3-amino-2-methylpropionate transaminase
MPRLSSNIRPTRDLLVSHADGAKFWDVNGKQYIDLSSQSMNLLFGQRHPKIYEEVFSALQRFTFVDQDFASPDYEVAMQKLSKLIPSQLTVFNFRMNDGSSAVECAVKQARRKTGRSRVLTVDGIYLGQNAQTIHFRGWGVRPEDMLIGGREDVVFAPIPLPDYDIAFEEAVNENGQALADLIREHRQHLACVLLDPIMISSGVTTGRDMRSFLKKAEEVCQEYRVPLIFDECQTFGWVPGNTLAGLYGINIDMLVLGKGVGGGLPLSVCASREEYDNLRFGDADYTNGGTAASIAGLIATCGLLSSPDEQEHFARLSEHLTSALVGFQRLHPDTTRTRGVGLIRALEIHLHRKREDNVETVRRAASSLLGRGVYIRCHGNCFTFKLPRVTTIETLDEALGVVFEVLDDILRRT